ncbi:hypothetical protein PH7735_01446 [Shimia thalassica]|uniref:Uncharacterized protein n=1 Tax=Shimia thalassica TaxID=1715693 RepID=A0A0P1IH21_9RHOB|nr:hypothetical protein PH7735_01446 [Shimia thalassica]
MNLATHRKVAQANPDVETKNLLFFGPFRLVSAVFYNSPLQLRETKPI